MYVAVTNIKGTGLRSGERRCVGELDQNARYVYTHFSNVNKVKPCSICSLTSRIVGIWHITL